MGPEGRAARNRLIPPDVLQQLRETGLDQSWMHETNDPVLDAEQVPVVESENVSQAENIPLNPPNSVNPQNGHQAPAERVRERMEEV